MKDTFMLLLHPFYIFRCKIASTCITLQTLFTTYEKEDLSCVIIERNHLRLPIGESMNEDNGLSHLK